MYDIRNFRDDDGREPFEEWFMRLDAAAAVRVQRLIDRMALGNLGDAKPVGAGVVESRIHWGPGYRLYFGLDGTTVVILLAGGVKRSQDRDVRVAQARWAQYRRRRR